MDLAFEVLGPLRVWRDGEPLAIDAAKQRILLAVLLLAEGEAVSRDVIIEALWSEKPPATAVNLVQTYVKDLRKLIEPDRPARAPASVLVSAGDGYRMVLDEGRLDLARFRRVVQEAADARRAGDSVRERGLLRQVSELWRGPILDELGSAWPPTAAVEQALQGAAVRYADLALAAGEASKILPRLVKLTGWTPWNESLHARLITAYAAAGGQAEALEAYERVRVRLRDELGVDPGAELRRAHMAVLQQQDQAARPALWRGRRPLPEPVIGRDDDLRRLTELAPARRLVTLFGPGGAGKTTLALATASLLANGYHDGVAVVELGVLPAAPDGDQLDLVAEAIGGALNVRPGREGAEAAVVRALRERRLLLLLDNAEHVSGGVARLVDRLLRECTMVHVLVTSRRPLGIGGETVWDVPPLTEAAAVELFTRRAGEHCPGLDLSADRANVLELCRRLDGLPLAIELVVPRLRSMSPAVLAERITLSLVSGIGQGGLPHQRTMARTIQWSLDLLDDQERRLLSRLAVFAGEFELAAAEQVCGAGGLEVVQMIGQLVDASLVRALSHGRYGYRLLAPIREYALEVADEADLAATRRRHLDRLAAMAHALASGEDRAARLQALRGESADVVTAFAWAFRPEAGEEAVTGAALLVDGQVAVVGGESVGAMLGWTRRALDHESSLSRPLRARVYACLGGLSYAAGQPARAQADMEQAAELFDPADPEQRRHLTEVMMRLGRSAFVAARPDAAERVREAVALARQSEDSGLVAHCFPYSAMSLAWLGHCEEALGLVAEAAKAGAEPPFPNHAAVVALRCGQVGEAVERAESILARQEAYGPGSSIHAFYTRAMAQLLDGDHEGGSSTLAEGMDLVRRFGWDIVRPDFSLGFAYADWMGGWPDSALVHLADALRRSLDQDDVVSAVVAAHAGAVLAEETAHPRATEIIAAARECRARTGVLPWPFPGDDVSADGTYDREAVLALLRSVRAVL